MKYELGEVVCCYPLDDRKCFGVVVRLPIEGDHCPPSNSAACYRVRIVTYSFTDFVEIGVTEGFMARKGERIA